MHREHGTASGRHHECRDAAEYQSGETGATVGAEHEEISTLGARGPDDPVGRHVFDEEAGGACPCLLGARSLDLEQDADSSQDVDITDDSYELPGARSDHGDRSNLVLQEQPDDIAEFHIGLG